VLKKSETTRQNLNQLPKVLVQEGNIGEGVQSVGSRQLLYDRAESRVFIIDLTANVNEQLFKDS
jgi:hypothetical protein